MNSIVEEYVGMIEGCGAVCWDLDGTGVGAIALPQFDITLTVLADGAATLDFDEGRGLGRELVLTPMAAW